MRKNILLYGLSIATLLIVVLTVRADDNVPEKRNDDGTWTIVKPAGVDLKLEVIYFTKEELDSIAALNSGYSLNINKDTVTNSDGEVQKQETTNVQNKPAKRSRSRHGRSRHRSRRR